MLTLVPAAPPVSCDAYRLLTEAEAALSYSQYIEAGCYLREGIRRLLVALCEFNGIPLSRNRSRRTTGLLMDRLLRTRNLEPGDAEQLEQAIEVGNKAAHLVFVTADDLYCAIRDVRWFYDSTPFAKGGIA